jgi:hypothetical protein
MDSTGFIEGLGVPASAVLAPSVGLAVTKSGRTTGTTTGLLVRSTQASPCSISKTAVRARRPPSLTRTRL